MEYDRENNGSTTQNVVFNESSSDYGVKPLNIEEEVDAPVLVDSWVKIDSSDIFKESEQVVEICQAQKVTTFLKLLICQVFYYICH